MAIRNPSGRVFGLAAVTAVAAVAAVVAVAVVAVVPLVASVVQGAAASARERPPGPPALILGDFTDDYGNQYTVTPTEFLQRPRASYIALRWDSAGQFLIARNGANNPGDANLYSRIDWMPLTGMAPYEWAFCLSAYNAPSAAAAESTHVAKRETPRTGCNGFPFSRMKRWSRAPG